MSAEPDEVALAAAEDAAFASGFPDPPPKPDKNKPEPKPAKAEPKAKEPEPDAPVVETPEYVQVTKKDWDEIRAATASHEGQFRKAFGTIGSMQKLINSFQAQTPAGRKVEIPKDAFAAMERDFPELAQQTRGALEAALSGMSGTGPVEIDADKINTLLATYQSKREIEALEDQFPDWKSIVGAVDVSREQPDPNNAFRKWLATKDIAYQNRLNSSDSAAVISRAIRTFQTETKGAKPVAGAKPRDDARAERIREAVQPRGDHAGAAAGPSDDDEFMAGFNSR